MKKVVLFFAIAIAAFSANAQKGSVRYGIKAGINVSTLGLSSDDASATQGNKVGFNGGVFVELPVSANFIIQPEALYSMMGTKAGETKINLDYISVPVLAKYNSGGLAVYAGPQVGFLMSAKSKDDDGSEDIKDDLKSIDFSGVFGTEYAFNCGVILSARYQLGLADIADDDSFGGDGKLKNHGFNFTIGYRFGSKK